MSVYQRYTSREYDEEYFERRTKSKKLDRNVGHIKISPLVGHFSTQANPHRFREKKIEEWLEIFPKAAYFKGHDETLFGEVIVMIYENLQTGKLSTTSFSKFGVTSYDNLILDARSRFWPSCENLLPKYQKSNVRRSLAITNLKNYNKLVNNPGNFQINKSWDETYAGNLANNMTLISEISPHDFGLNFLELGLLQAHYIQSTVLDVVYDNSSPETNEKIIEENNKLVFLIGTQLEQLFDPLLEYSPEIMEFSYNTPIESDPPQIMNNGLINTIINELFSVQTNFTMGLVNLLQNFIIPLRVNILSATSSSGITKINKIFPPTIDEVTRINCILHDALSRASKYGYPEVIKALGTIMPYFYKAFVRHEANLKSFRTNLSKFYNKYNKKVFENETINKGKFNIREIDSIVSGSLLELPKLKLILVRLKEAIMSERTKLRNFEDSSDEEYSKIEEHFKSAIDVIDAFGFEEDRKKNSIDIRQRVFTPTGKILTELAHNWPTELQYGWLARKVVGIYEMRNIKPLNDKFYDLDILIIFSDHILFLTIVDDEYYFDRNSESSKNLSVSDILMNSLVNDKPLPNLALLPAMEVSCWCDINEVITSTYKSKATISSTYQEFLKFVNISDSGFSSNNNNLCITSKNYEILDENHDGCKIIELINKSTVLNKRKPFHLFRSNDPKLHIYSIAQDLWAYQEETCKTAMVLYLNLPIENPKEYFAKNERVNLVLNASFINDHQIHILGFNRAQTFEMNEIISSGDLQVCLREVIVKNFDLLFNSFSDISRMLSQGYVDDLNYCSNLFTKFNKHELNMRRAEAIRKNDIDSKSNLKMKQKNTHNSLEVASIPEVYMTKVLQSNASDSKNNVQLSHIDEASVQKSHSTESGEITEKSSKRNKNSLIRNVFRNIRKSLDSIDGKLSIQSDSTDNTKIDTQESVSFIGKNKEYTNLYKPVPKLQATESIKDSSNMSVRENQYLNISQLEHMENSKSPLQSRNTSGSLDINSHFEFPPLDRSIGESNENTIVMVNEPERENIELLPEDEVIVLDGINKSRKREDASYEKYDIEDFYKDGEANWVSLSNKQASFLNSEIRALKEEANMDSEDVIEIKTSDNESNDETHDIYDIEADDAFYTPKNQPVTKFDDKTSSRNRDVSIQSLAPSEVIEEFGKQIDFDFGNTDDIHSFQSQYSNDHRISSETLNDYRTSGMFSSDDEFFSSDEFASTLPKKELPYRKATSPITITSSNATIIDESFDEKLLPAVPINNKSHVSNTPYSGGNIRNESLRNDSFSTTYESMTYLSEILKI